jgi:hypothetical protein
MSASGSKLKAPGNSAGRLKNVPGAPNVQQTMNFNKEAMERVAMNNYETVNLPGERASNEFPLIPFAKDTYDDVAEMKKQMANAAIAGGENWVVPFDQQDANYLLRKRAQVEQADFDRWLYKKYDLRDPAQMFLFQQIAPEQFQRRQEVIDYQQNLVSRYAKLRLRGAKNLSDLQFEWLIETGRIELPKGPIWDPSSWMNKQEEQPLDEAGIRGIANAWGKRANYNLWSSRYRKGIFSMLKVPDGSTVGWERSANVSDIRGDSSTPVTGQMMQNSDYSNYLQPTLYGSYANSWDQYNYADNKYLRRWGNNQNPGFKIVADDDPTGIGFGATFNAQRAIAANTLHAPNRGNANNIWFGGN